MKTSTNKQYKEYLRGHSIYIQSDLAKVPTKEIVSPFPPHSDQTLPKEKNLELCIMHYTKQHSCFVGSKNCIFAHSIQGIKEQQTAPFQYKKKVLLFNGLSFWVTTFVLSFLEDPEILKFRTVNKEASLACKKSYSARNINLSKISLVTAKFFERA